MRVRLTNSGTWKWNRTPLRVVLVAAAVGLPVVGLATGIMVLPIAAVGCLIGAVALPKARPRAQEPPETLPVAIAIQRIRAAVQDRLPQEDVRTISRICESIGVALEAWGGAHADCADPDLYRIRQTALSYLPEAIDAYLAVPHEYGNVRGAATKDPHSVLVDQLRLLDESTRRLAERAVAGDANRLEAHGRFLAEKFGRSTLDIESAPTPAPGSSPDAEADSGRSIP